MGNETSTNPVHKELLDKLPEQLHQFVTPILQKWDQHAESKIQEVKDQYKPYEFLLENEVDPEYVNQSLMLAHNLQQDPAGLVGQITSTFDTGWMSPEQVQAQIDALKDGDDLSLHQDPSEFKLEDHPQFKAMHDALESMKAKDQERESSLQEQQAVAEHERTLDKLEEKYKDKGGINRTLVTAFMSQDLSPDDAVKAYHDMIAEQLAANPTANQPDQQQAQDTSTPVILGQADGSGAAETPIDFGSLGKNKSSLKNAVTEYLNKSNSE